MHSCHCWQLRATKILHAANVCQILETTSMQNLKCVFYVPSFYLFFSFSFPFLTTFPIIFPLSMFKSLLPFSFFPLTKTGKYLILLIFTCKLTDYNLELKVNFI